MHTSPPPLPSLPLPPPPPPAPSYPSSQQKTCAVGSSVVGQPHRHTILGQLVRIGCSKHHVPLNLGVHHLACDVLVGETNHQTILWCVVLVSVLSNQPLAGIVVSLPLCRRRTRQRNA